MYKFCLAYKKCRAIKSTADRNQVYAAPHLVTLLKKKKKKEKGRKGAKYLKLKWNNKLCFESF